MIPRLTYTDFPERDETFTFSINWGDGTAPSTGSGMIDQPGAAGIPTAGSFDGNHTYAAPGTYVVTVRVTDDDTGYRANDGAADSNEATVTIVTATNSRPVAYPQSVTSAQGEREDRNHGQR